MSILSEARQLLAETDQKIKDPALSGTETAWVAINFADKMSVMLPEVLAYAEMREAQAIHDHAKVIEATEVLASMGSQWPLGSPQYLERAAKELSADLPAWHKITEEEREAIQDAILCFKAYERDEKETIEVLRGMIA